MVVQRASIRELLPWFVVMAAICYPDAVHKVRVGGFEAVEWLKSERGVRTVMTGLLAGVGILVALMPLIMFIEWLTRPRPVPATIVGGKGVVEGQTTINGALYYRLRTGQLLALKHLKIAEDGSRTFTYTPSEQSGRIPEAYLQENVTTKDGKINSSVQFRRNGTVVLQGTLLRAEKSYYLVTTGHGWFSDDAEAARDYVDCITVKGSHFSLDAKARNVLLSREVGFWPTKGKPRPVSKYHCTCLDLCAYKLDSRALSWLADCGIKASEFAQCQNPMEGEVVMQMGLEPDGTVQACYPGKDFDCFGTSAHKANTSPGMSGAPLVQILPNGHEKLVGIHVGAIEDGSKLRNLMVPVSQVLTYIRGFTWRKKLDMQLGEERAAWLPYLKPEYNAAGDRADCELMRQFEQEQYEVDLFDYQKMHDAHHRAEGELQRSVFGLLYDDPRMEVKGGFARQPKKPRRVMRESQARKRPIRNKSLLRPPVVGLKEMKACYADGRLFSHKMHAHDLVALLAMVPPVAAALAALHLDIGQPNGIRLANAAGESVLAEYDWNQTDGNHVLFGSPKDKESVADNYRRLGLLEEDGKPSYESPDMTSYSDMASSFGAFAKKIRPGNEGGGLRRALCKFLDRGDMRPFLDGYGETHAPDPVTTTQLGFRGAFADAVASVHKSGNPGYVPFADESTKEAVIEKHLDTIYALVWFRMSFIASCDFTTCDWRGADYIAKGLRDPVRVTIKNEPHDRRKADKREFRTIQVQSLMDEVCCRLSHSSFNKRATQLYQSGVLAGQPFCVGIGHHDEGHDAIVAHLGAGPDDVCCSIDVSGMDASATYTDFLEQALWRAGWARRSFGAAQFDYWNLSDDPADELSNDPWHRWYLNEAAMLADSVYLVPSRTGYRAFGLITKGVLDSGFYSTTVMNTLRIYLGLSPLSVLVDDWTSALANGDDTVVACSRPEVTDMACELLREDNMCLKYCTARKGHFQFCSHEYRLLPDDEYDVRFLGLEKMLAGLCVAKPTPEAIFSQLNVLRGNARALAKYTEALHALGHFDGLSAALE